MWVGPSQSIAEDRRQLDLEGCMKARVGSHVLGAVLRVVALLAFGQAGETDVLEAWIDSIFVMGGWFYSLKEIFRSEAGGAAGERSSSMGLS